MQQFIEFRVDQLVYGGEALGRLQDGKAVFVPYAIPGEHVRVRLVEDKPRFARAELVEVLDAVAERVSPRCHHFSTCGGCHYQHIGYPAQLQAKKAILEEQLRRMGGLKDIPAVSVEPSPESYAYRNHIQFHLTRDGMLGFQKARSNETLAIRECHLPETAINDIWPRIEVDPFSGLKRVSVRLGADGEAMVVLEGLANESFKSSLEDLAISIVQISSSGQVVLAGRDHIFLEVLGRSFKVSAGSFFQVNTLQANKMVQHLVANLPLDEAAIVLDLYCGVGLFSAFLAPRVKRLIGIEISPTACDDFSSNLDEFNNVELYEAKVEEVLFSQQFNPEIIIMDPPRTGLGAKAVQGLIAQGARRLVYVSCDPATLARDARELVAGGYQMRQVTLFDLFPQTYHIESISYWDKE